MKLGLKRKIVLVFIGVLVGVSVLDALLASYFTNRQNQDAAFATLKRDLLTWQDELQALTLHMRTVALSAVGETVALNQLSELKSLEYKLAEALDKNKGVKEAARTLAFSKSVSLNRLHLVLRTGGFSAIAVYVDGKLSHQVSVSEVGMFVQRSNGARVWVKATADGNGNLPLRSWPAWEEGAPPVADSLAPVDRPGVSFTYPSADGMLIEVAVPVEGVIEQSGQQGEGQPPELSVIDPLIAGSASDPSLFAANRPPSPFAVVVFQKRVDQAYLQTVERKTGMWPLLFSPDGQHSRQIGPLSLSLQQLLPDLAGATSGIKAQTVSIGKDSFYAAALPWQFELQPGFVLALVASQDSTLHNIRQTVLAILAVTGLILAFSIGVGIFWVGRFIDPIIALTNALKAIGLGSPVGRDKPFEYLLTADKLHPLAIRAPGEVGDLAWAFDMMIATLKKSFDTLEQRVQDRTVELLALQQVLEKQNRRLEKQRLELIDGNRLLQEEIGERKLIEDLLRLREQEFRSLAENSPDNIARYDRDCRIRYWNSRLHTTLDLPDFISSRAHIGKTTTELYPDGRFDDYEAALKSVMESGQEIEYEAVGPDIGAGIRHHLVRMVAERDQHGEVIGVLAMGRDITERKRIEETLIFIAQCSWKEGGESFLSALARYLGKVLEVDYVIVDKLADDPAYAETVAIYAKGEVLPNMQYSLKGTPCENVMQGGLCCHVADVQRQFPEDTLLVDMQVESYSGLPLWDSSGTVIGLIAVMDGKPVDDAADITSILQLVATRAAAELERERSERSLAESRQFLNQVIDAIPDPVFVKDREHRWILLNQEFCDFIGHPMETLLGQSDYDFFPAQEADVFWAQDEVVFNSGKEAVNEEEFTDRHGVTHNIQTKKICYTDDLGQRYLVGIILDLTERKQYELSLLKRVQLEEHLSGLAASVPGFMFTIRSDANGHASFPFASAGIEQLVGLRPEDIRDDLAVLHTRYHPDDLPRLFALFEQSRQTLALFAIEIRIFHPDIGMRWAEIRSTPQRQQDGSTEWHGLMIDVTERKQMEEALGKSRQILTEAQRIAHVGSWELNLADNSLSWSDETFRIFEIDQEQFEASYEAFIETIHPDDREAVNRAYTESLEQRTRYEIEHRLLMADGRVKYVLERCETRYDANGIPLSSLGTVQDITERKAAEKQLGLLNYALDRVKDTVSLIGEDAGFCYVNKEFCRVLGYSYDEMLSLGIPDIDPDYGTERWSEHWLELKAKGSLTFESCHKTKDDRLFPVEINANYFEFDGQAYNLSLARDITERKQMDDALRKSRQTLTEAQRIAQVGSWDWDVVMNRVEWSEMAYDIYTPDKRPAAPSFDDFRSSLHPDDVERVVAAVQSAFEHDTPFDIDHRVVSASQGVRTVHAQAKVFRDASGKPVRMVGTVQDITERKRMEAELLSQADFQQTILNAVADAGMQVMMIEEGRIIHVGNRKLAYQFGFTDQDIDAYPALTEIIHPDDRERILDYHIRRVTGKASPASYELGLVTRSGERREYETAVATVPNTHPVRVISVGKDIGERKRMETELKSQADFQQTLLNSIRDVGMQMLVIENGRMVYIGNRTSAHKFGFIDEEIAAHPSFIDFVHPNDRERVIGYHISRMKGEAVPSSYELGLVNRNGERREFETSVAVVPGTDPVRTIAICKDITERKRMEQALAAREQELRALAESSPGMVGSFYSRPDGSVCMPYASANIWELFGLRPEEVADDASPLLALNHPADAERVAASIAESARTMTTWHTEFRILHPTRGERWMEGNTNPQLHPDGGIVWYGYVHDITERKRAEEDKQRLINILEQSADFIGSADMQGRLLYHNRAARRMVGLPEDADLSAMSMADMHPEWAIKMIKEQGIPTLLKDGVWHGETAVRHRDGREIPVSQLLVLHRDADGKPLFHSTIMRDITERKQAENEIRALNASLEQRVMDRTEALRLQTRYLRTMIDTLPMMVWFKDTDSKYLIVNYAFATACSHSVEDLAGKSDLDIYPREHADAYRADDAKVMATGRLMTLEEPFVDAHNGAIWIETFKAPVLDEDGRVLGTVGVARDISERKAVEAAREAALAEAERLVRLRSEFMARMSHELRTPLNGILGYAQILLGENKLNERQNVMVNVMQQSGEHLLNLINDILDFAKIEAGKQKLSLSDVQLTGFLRNIADIVSVRAEQKNLAFICDIATDVPKGICIDEVRLRQVLLNLLSNAVKYSEHGQVCLRVTLLEPGRLRFKVQDSGIGIASDQLESIFRPFEQAGDSRSHSGGTGLGLVISRELAKLMGSDIFVTSRIGEGSSFWFDLDVQVVDVYRDMMPVKQHATGYMGRRLRVLVVDDVDANRALLVDMLSHLGFETVEAVNGRACLDSAKKRLPDLVLLDMVMPEMDGLEVARRLRGMPLFGQTPIIAVSASASGTDVADAMEAGVNVFLSKPIEIKKLMAQIGSLLKLNWIYTLPEAEPAPQYKQDEWLDVPPMEDMQILYQLALEGSMKDIIHQTARLQELDERYRPFAEQLRKLSQDYQSKAVLDLVERYINIQPQIDTDEHG